AAAATIERGDAVHDGVVGDEDGTQGRRPGGIAAAGADDLVVAAGAPAAFEAAVDGRGGVGEDGDHDAASGIDVIGEDVAEGRGVRVGPVRPGDDGVVLLKVGEGGGEPGVDGHVDDGDAVKEAGAHQLGLDIQVVGLCGRRRGGRR